MEKVIVGSGEILRKRRMGVEFTIGVVSTGILTFPKSVISFKMIDKIFRKVGGLVGWVVVFGGTGSNTGAETAKDIGHELVTGWVVTRKEVMSFRCCKNA